MSSIDVYTNVTCRGFSFVLLRCRFGGVLMLAFVNDAGVFSCSLLLNGCLGADRMAPEALVFLTSALALFGRSKNAPVRLA